MSAYLLVLLHKPTSSLQIRAEAAPAEYLTQCAAQGRRYEAVQSRALEFADAATAAAFNQTLGAHLAPFATAAGTYRFNIQTLFALQQFLGEALDAYKFSIVRLEAFSDDLDYSDAEELTEISASAGAARTVPSMDTTRALPLVEQALTVLSEVCGQSLALFPAEAQSSADYVVRDLVGIFSSAQLMRGMGALALLEETALPAFFGRQDSLELDRSHQAFDYAFRVQVRWPANSAASDQNADARRALSELHPNIGGWDRALDSEILMGVVRSTYFPEAPRAAPARARAPLAVAEIEAGSALPLAR